MVQTTANATDALSVFYAVKPASYFSGARSDFVDRLPRDGSAEILEIGCGNGATGALALSEGCCRRYVGIEASETAAEEARDVLTEVITGDVEVLDFDWQPASFDAVILSDVIERLGQPEELLQRIGRYVRPGGMLLASSPNVSHWRVIRELIMGRFDHADGAAVDRTHLRFTPQSFAAMVEAAGFAVDEIGPVTPFSTRAEVASKLTCGRFDHLFMTQIAIVATKR